MHGNQQREKGSSRRLMDGGTFIVEPGTAPLGDARSSAFRTACEHVSNNFFLEIFTSLFSCLVSSVSSDLEVCSSSDDRDVRTTCCSQIILNFAYLV